ncbi:MAG TPA: prolipoprotein diacylglyceryl transferase family protein [Capsulimonadaceae bacterium]|nr:prolipoprotein diacylglyceryl transferase family protein [Capsulimonadaceae bacterium]
MLPPITLSSVCYLLGYLAGLGAFVWLARRRRLATEGVMALLAAGLLGGLVFANIAQWVSTDEAGKTILGAVAGGYLTVALFKRRLGIKRPLGDLFALAMSAGEAVGRWGCFFGGCCYGKPSHVLWAVWQHGAWRYPTQIYLSLTSFAIFLLLLRLELRRPLPENGLFYVQGALFCISRFVIEFFREGSPPIFGLTLAQWACIAGLLFFLARLLLLPKPNAQPTLAPEGAGH